MSNIVADMTKTEFREMIESVVGEVLERKLAEMFADPDEFNSWKETLYLLSNPANAGHLRKSIAELEAGKITERELIET